MESGADRRGTRAGRGSIEERHWSFVLQAAIAAEHCRAATASDTNWPAIVALYDRLEREHPSPVISLNKAAALAMAEGPASALPIMDALKLTGDLDEYHLFHSSRAELLRRLGRFDEAADSYARALALAGSEDERRFLERRLRDVQDELQRGITEPPGR